ncbi:MAG: hypothetical protein WA705_22905 [Candidatus Ozemobacteraceae bacterium]
MRTTYAPAALLVGLLAIGATAAFAEVADEMKYLGYSSELSGYATTSLAKTHKIPPGQTTPPGLDSARNDIDEPTAVTEQLAELGRSRNLTPGTPDKSGELNTTLKGYWETMSGRSLPFPKTLTPEFKNSLKDRIKQALDAAGYTVKQLDLIDAPPNMGTPRARAVVRVTRELKTQNGYAEIQQNLGEIKQLCLTAGTVDGMPFLTELTSFVAENPRNKYYYEKTVLNP